MIDVTEERVFVPEMLRVELDLADSTRDFDSFYARN